jgi:glycosyltransferase involved in cell wall biosynthesis
MLVTFDHSAFSLQPYGGVARYFAELAQRLDGREGCGVRVLAPVYQNHYLRQIGGRLVTGAYLPPIAHTGRLRRAVNEALTRRLLRRYGTDILHETYYRSGRVAPERVRTVLTVYDMIHERLPEYFPPGDPTATRKAVAIRRADRVICISEATRADLLDLMPEAAHKVTVIPLASSFKGAGEELSPPRIDGPFLLYVGDRRGYKNFSRLLRAFALAGQSLAGVRLACFGGGPFTAAEANEIRELHLGNRVLRTAGDDGVLEGLYRHAAALVYPSLYEGFGMPPLEAMSFGCPVVCSGTSSLPEVVADAAELVDPTSVEGIAASLVKVVGCSDRASELRRLGFERCRVFTWERCVSATLDLYSGLASEAAASSV